jgi:uncharacterized membrane protein SirB2
MQLEQTATLQFLMQLQPQAVVVVATTAAVLVSLEEVVAVVEADLVITQAVVVVEPERQEEMQHSRQAPTVVNTALVLSGKDILAVEEAAIFTLQDKAVAV